MSNFLQGLMQKVTAAAATLTGAAHPAPAQPVPVTVEIQAATLSEECHLDLTLPDQSAIPVTAKTQVVRMQLASGDAVNLKLSCQNEAVYGTRTLKLTGDTVISFGGEPQGWTVAVGQVPGLNLSAAATPTPPAATTTPPTN